MQHHNKYNLYANPQDKNPEQKEKIYFDRMVDLFMLAVVHGFKLGIRKPLKNSKDIFKWSNFDEPDRLIIQGIALLDNNKEGIDNPDILNSKSEILQIVQEYANAGFDDLMVNLEASTDFERNFMYLLTDELEEKDNK